MACEYDEDTEIKIVDYDVEAKRLANDPIELDLRELEDRTAYVTNLRSRRDRRILATELHADAREIRDRRRMMNENQRSRFIRTCGAITRIMIEAD